MDFMNRGNQSQPANNPQPTAHASHSVGKPGSGRGGLKGLRIASVVLLFSVTVLVISLVLFLIFGGPSTKSESKYVDSGKMQAVFLNGGQVYFGRIQDLNDKYVRLTDIFYLRVNQVVQPDRSQTPAQNDISLVKLGCELHRPTNEMLINRQQVVFWENLKDETGENTVPGAVKTYMAQFPNGQECQDQTQQNTNSGGGNNTNSGNNNNNDGSGVDL